MLISILMKIASQNKGMKILLFNPREKLNKPAIIEFHLLKIKGKNPLKKK